MSEHRPRAVTPSELRGRGTGIVVCAIFAALWTNWAAPMLSESALCKWSAALAVAVLSGTLLFAGVATIREGRRLSRATATREAGPRGMRRQFVVVLAWEILALNVAAYLLIGHQMVQYLAPAVALVVGLHFLPLAKIFRAPHYYATATAMTLAGIAAAMAIATGNAAVTTDGILDLACAIALWGTGFVSWSRVHKDVARNRTVIAAADPAHRGSRLPRRHIPSGD
jgi:hypothetical protein